tara:strand:+ start:107 stop:811 length:705 start_codon:yes stop_codon:yes gene_type:complete
MDIEAILESQEDAKSIQALSTFLNKFTNPAFGALPKSEMELLVLDLLEHIGAISSEPEVYELVSNLKITRNKARRLLYERELRRLSPTQLDMRVKELLKRPIIQKAGEQFVLEIENPLLSDHLRSKVQKLGYISDGSFSPSIVKLSLDAIVALIQLYLEDDEQTEVRQALVQAGAPDTSFRGVLKAVLKKVANKVAADTGEELLNNASEYMSPIVDATVEGLSEKVSGLYPQKQ